jgi:hypothetical protein
MICFILSFGIFFEHSLHCQTNVSWGSKYIVNFLCLIYSADEALGEEEKKEAQEHERDNDDDDDDEVEEEDVKEYGCTAMVITEEVRRCNRNNGRKWTCADLAEPGYKTCSRHIKSRREAYQRFLSNKVRGSTSGSEAIVEPNIEDAPTSAVGDQEEAASPSSPRTLAHAKRRKAGDSTMPDDEVV